MTRSFPRGGTPAASGLTLYTGPSLLDGSPIAAVATGFLRASENRATGPMLQTWVFRQDVPPAEAVAAGLDAAVCGDCPLRSPRLCYVTVHYAPQQVWKCWRRGDYPKATPRRLEWFKGRSVRLGSYGNPSAVPLKVWRDAVFWATWWTGYDHGWKAAPRDFATLVMASVETPAGRELAKRKGYRTFRVKAPGDPVLPGERECPKQGKFPNPTTCSECGWCSGDNGGFAHDVVCDIHGGGNVTEAGLRRAQALELPLVRAS